MDTRCASVQSLVVFDTHRSKTNTRERLDRTVGKSSLRYHLRNAIRNIQTKILKRHLKAKGKGSFRRHSSPEELYSMLRKYSTQYECGMSRCQSMCNLNVGSVKELKSQLLSELSLLKCLILEEEALLDQMDELKRKTSRKLLTSTPHPSSSTPVFSFKDCDVDGYINMTYMGRSDDALSTSSTPITSSQNCKDNNGSQLLSYYYPKLPLHEPTCKLNCKQCTTRKKHNCVECTCTIEDQEQHTPIKPSTMRGRTDKDRRKQRRPTTFYISSFPPTEIDPKIMADIEAFEAFAAQKLNRSLENFVSRDR